VQAFPDGRYAMRLVMGEVPALESKSMSYVGSTSQPGGTYDFLAGQRWAKNPGLLLITGSTGSGKTTLASSVISANLRRHGGYAMMIEEPIETRMSGWHDKGFCDQIDASWDGYSAMVEQSLRTFPVSSNGILMLGEIRDPVAAGECLRTALDGRRVIVTMHAKSRNAAVERLISLAVQNGESESRARTMLAEGLYGIVHLEVQASGIVCRHMGIDAKSKEALKSGDAFDMEIRERDAKAMLGLTQRRP